MKGLEIKMAKKVLEDHGFFVGNLWHIEDVQINYMCGEDDAMSILESVLTSDDTISSINYKIDLAASEEGFEEKI